MYQKTWKAKKEKSENMSGMMKTEWMKGENIKDDKNSCALLDTGPHCATYTVWAIPTMRRVITQKPIVKKKKMDK